MATLTELKLKTPTIRVRFGERRANKNFKIKKVMEANGLKNKKAAVKWIRAWAEKEESREALGENIYGAEGTKPSVARARNSGPSLGEVFDAWLLNFSTAAHGKTRKRMAPTTCEYKLGIFKNHLRDSTPNWPGEHAPLASITRGMIKRHLKDIEARGLSIEFVGKVRSVIRSLYDWTVESDELKSLENPMLKRETTSRPVGASASERKIIEMPDIADAELLIAAAREDAAREIAGPKLMKKWAGGRTHAGTPGWFLLYVILGFKTGLRGGELRGLTWGAIDLDNLTLEVMDGANAKGKLGFVKNASALRTVPFDDEVLRELLEYKARWIPNDLDLLFAGRDDKPLFSSCPRKRWNRILARLGMVNAEGKNRFTPHAMRHFAISNWIAEGIRGKELTIPIGHSDFATTEKYYWHLFEKDRSNSFDAMRKATKTNVKIAA